MRVLGHIEGLHGPSDTFAGLSEALVRPLEAIFVRVLNRLLQSPQMPAYCIAPAAWLCWGPQRPSLGRLKPNGPSDLSWV